MSTSTVLKTTIFFMVLALTGCIEPYTPPAIQNNVDILVVDGYLNTTDSTATVQLSKAVPLSSEGGQVPEHNAAVRVEDEAGNFFPLYEIGEGNYYGEKLPLNSSLKYRLYIATNSGQKFVSDYVELKTAPPIDSISYRRADQDDGLAIFVNTHDPSNNTKYYQWTYVETWEYNSAFFSSVEIIGGKVVDQDDDIYQCWTTRPSTEINVASTTQLTIDAIRNFQLIFIPKGSQKVNRKYSIEVQQRALTKDAYNFWSQLKKSTESLGGLFDPMPSQVTGNLRSASESTLPVLGYFSGGQASKKRIFIGRENLPEGLAFVIPPPCPVDTIRLDEIASRPNMNLIGPYGYPFVEGYLSSNGKNCLDCRDNGGKNVRPDFWQ